MRFAPTWAIVVAAAVIGVTAQSPAALARSAQPIAGTASGFHLPYTDPNQAGWLTLCGVGLKPITHGLITTKPFVWRVVSDVPAPKGYFVKGAKAQMFAYQPRQYTPAGAWSGENMGATPSFYSNGKHPMAQFTPIDQPLSYFTIAYPPIWDHLVELRLYLGAPNTPEDTLGYAAADVQVKGNSWTLVAGGHSSCTSGRAVSEEVVVGIPGARGTPRPQPTGSAAASPSTSPGTAPSSGSSGSQGAVPVANSHTSGSGAAALAFGVVAVVVAAMASGGLWWRRRRRATG